MAARAQDSRWVPGLLALPFFAAIGVIAGVDPKWGVFAALAIVLVLVALTDLAAAVVVLIVVTFAESTPLVGSAVSATKLTGLVLTIGWLAYLATRPARPNTLIFTTFPGFSYLLVLFLTWVALSMTWATNSSLALEEASGFLLLAVLYSIVFTAIRSRRSAMLVIGGFVAGTAISAAYGLATRPTLDTVEAGRLVSTVQDPNFLAMILIAGISLAGASFLAARGRPGLRLLAGSAAVVCLAAFVLTGSRGGLIGLGFVLLAAIAFGGRWRGRLAIAAVTVALCTVGYFTLYAPQEAKDRLVSATQGEVGQRDARYTIWTVGWRMVEDNPVAGVGVGNFEENSINYVLEPGTNFRTDRVIDRPGVAHNSYLGPLAELGVIGAALFLAIIGFSLACAARAAWEFSRKGDVQMEALARGVLIGLVGMLVAAFFISAEGSKIIWLLMAMGPAMLSIARAEPGAGPEDSIPPAEPRAQPLGWSSGAGMPAARPS